MQVTVVSFGQVAEAIGAKTISVPDVEDTDQLLKALYGSYSGLKGIEFKLAVNKLMINSNTIFNGQTEVALLPPFSGG